MAKDDDINEHKRMAMGGEPDSGNFGVDPMSSHSRGDNADLNRVTHRKTNRDSERGASRPVERGGDMHPAQAAPDHGAHDAY